ncbi:hypothetical protein STSP2_03177 [Anaerohalosphaera lusitana]|uniref:Uncharacterized protein n=1 Tax=Anaerohalosphaera lusitana TaxID=1936003 RepID=A0A1U9NQB6_9BACT|nr:hypothetical protein [Anaerohalosphaera lusitana]AQT69977.1 hypothetical protein STSP2_03177 [Anaerohalosphaera lusitana]
MARTRRTIRLSDHIGEQMEAYKDSTSIPYQDIGDVGVFLAVRLTPNSFFKIKAKIRTGEELEPGDVEFAGDEENF